MIYPNPRHLRAFVAVARLNSFNAAASEIHIGQPALSQAIANLEELVGVKLLERSTRSVVLTPAGEEFLIDAQHVLEENERLLSHSAQWSGSRRGKISLLSVPSMAYRLLPFILREFAKSYPDVGVAVHDHADPVLRERLARGDGDLAILTDIPHAGGAPVFPLLRDQFRFICHADHPLAAREHIGSKDLRSERLILLRHGALLRTNVEPLLGKLRLQHAPLEVDQTSTLIGMVEAGLGVSLLPGLSCPPAALQSVVSRPFDRPGLARVLGFARSPSRAPMPAVKALMDMTFSCLADQTPALPAGVSLIAPSRKELDHYFS